MGGGRFSRLTISYLRPFWLIDPKDPPPNPPGAAASWLLARSQGRKRADRRIEKQFAVEVVRDPIFVFGAHTWIGSVRAKHQKTYQCQTKE